MATAEPPGRGARAKALAAQEAKAKAKATAGGPPGPSKGQGKGPRQNQEQRIRDQPSPVEAFDEKQLLDEAGQLDSEFKRTYAEYMSRRENLKTGDTKWQPTEGVEGDGSMHLRFLSLQAQWRQMEWSKDLHKRYEAAGLDIDGASTVAALSNTISKGNLDTQVEAVLNELWDGVHAGDVMSSLKNVGLNRVEEERCVNCDAALLVEVLEDTNFCRKCGWMRAGTASKFADVCHCGNQFMEDSVFCRKCGSRRIEVETPQSPYANFGQSRSPPPLLGTPMQDEPRQAHVRQERLRKEALLGHSPQNRDVGFNFDVSQRSPNSASSRGPRSGPPAKSRAGQDQGTSQTRQELENLLAETARLESWLMSQAAQEEEDMPPTLRLAKPGKGPTERDWEDHRREVLIDELKHARKDEVRADIFGEISHELRRMQPLVEPSTGETPNDIPVSGPPEGYVSGQPMQLPFREELKKVEAEVALVTNRFRHQTPKDDYVPPVQGQGRERGLMPSAQRHVNKHRHFFGNQGPSAAPISPTGFG